MKWMVSLRDSLKKLYTDYDLIIKPLGRFLTAFLFLALLRRYVGYNEAASNPTVILVLSAISALFPAGFITFICAGYVLANMYSLSLSLFLLGSVFVLLVLLLYGGFRPGKAFYIILVPVGFLLNIPYAVPVILALSGGFASALPVSIGVIGWFMIDYLHDNGSSMSFTKDLTKVVKEFVSITEELFRKEELFLLLLAFLLCIGITAFLCRMSFDHSWTVAALSGLLIAGTVITAGNLCLGISGQLTGDLLQIFLSLPVVLLYEFLFFCVDYRSTERLQFEDDDYFYYVKAVPKIKAEETERRE